ncbi:MAG: hypothetical protein WAQ08_15740 [Aquabacterium sp.]|jgi:hypothetical protein|uniref:hypothetical protein n=1 Tax=Aquabacterium sp. TaxID=1872578 RepID=UPI003BAF47D7
MSGFSDDEAAELKASLQRARRQPMNFAAALGKRPEDHRLSLHHTRAGRALAKVLKEATGSKQLAFGTTEVDDSRKDTLVLVLDAKPPTGLAKKLANWLKLQGLPIRKVALKLEGQELSEDDDGGAETGIGRDDPEDAGSSNTAALAKIQAALKLLLPEVQQAIQTGGRLAPALRQAVQDLTSALKLGAVVQATEGVKKLNSVLRQAQAEALTQKDLGKLDEPGMDRAFVLIKTLQDDPKIQQERQALEKLGASVREQLLAARKAEARGDLAAAEKLKAQAHKERLAARAVLESCWPKRDARTKGTAEDWAPLVARLNVASPKDLAVFWSGDKEAAIDIAADQGGVALESTPGGTIIDDWDKHDPSKALPWNQDSKEPPPYLRDLWALASASYAESAQGKITIVQTPDRHPDGGLMWRLVEERILRNKARRGEITFTPPIVLPTNKT